MQASIDIGMHLHRCVSHDTDECSTFNLVCNIKNYVVSNYSFMQASVDIGMHLHRCVSHPLRPRCRTPCWSSCPRRRSQLRDQQLPW